MDRTTRPTRSFDQTSLGRNGEIGRLSSLPVLLGRNSWLKGAMIWTSVA